MGFPILGAEIELHDLQVGRSTSLPMITACMAQCIYQAVSKASPVLLEPLMDLEVIAAVVYMRLSFTHDMCVLID